MKRNMVNLLGALAVFSVLNLQVSIAEAQFITFTNPTPSYGDSFGYSLAAVGIDRVLIGAYRDDTGATDTGAAYLFSTNGVLLTTFTNPTPDSGDMFGFSVAALGTDRLLIGACGDNTGGDNAGAAYLFSTNGALLTTFTNPTPAAYDYFGFPVATVGADGVLIGADNDALGAGAAYLFRTDGALLTTFTNPAPAPYERFSISVAAVGTDQVLIGADQSDMGARGAGAAYLFSTNGALLTTFTNPTPADYDFFGYSVAAVGTDRVLIGAVYDDMGASEAKVAYLFSTSGALLTTLTDPMPAVGDRFGHSIAVLGTHQVLIGAVGDETGALGTGAGYLFSTNGTLLTTFTNPASSIADGFGISVAAMGSDWVLIGAPYADTGADHPGAAYLFSLATPTPEAPSLSIRLTTTNTVAVSWPSPWSGWTLQENTNGVASVHWSNAPGTIQDDGTNKTLVIVPPTENRFYRLFKP